MARGKSLGDKFWSKVDTSGDCWEWIGAKTSQGYGTLTHNGKQLLAHRVSLTMGGREPGIQVDHLCRNRLCVNPSHLEPVTIQENTARGNGKASRAMREDKCINGHDLLNAENIKADKRWAGRICKTCQKWYPKLARARKRDASLNYQEKQYLKEVNGNGK